MSIFNNDKDYILEVNYDGSWDILILEGLNVTVEFNTKDELTAHRFAQDYLANKDLRKYENIVS